MVRAGAWRETLQAPMMSTAGSGRLGGAGAGRVRRWLPIVWRVRCWFPRWCARVSDELRVPPVVFMRKMSPGLNVAQW